MAVVNRTSAILENLDFQVTWGRGQTRRSEARSLAPGEQVRIGISTSDLYLHKLTFTCRGKDVVYVDRPIATHGEHLVITVHPDGKVRQAYGE